jgi:hypothetical protein
MEARARTIRLFVFEVGLPDRLKRVAFTIEPTDELDTPDQRLIEIPRAAVRRTDGMNETEKDVVFDGLFRHTRKLGGLGYPHQIGRIECLWSFLGRIGHV